MTLDVRVGVRRRRRRCEDGCVRDGIDGGGGMIAGRMVSAGMMGAAGMEGVVGGATAVVGLGSLMAAGCGGSVAMAAGVAVVVGGDGGGGVRPRASSEATWRGGDGGVGVAAAVVSSAAGAMALLAAWNGGDGMDGMVVGATAVVGVVVMVSSGCGGCVGDGCRVALNYLRSTWRFFLNIFSHFSSITCLEPSPPPLTTARCQPLYARWFVL